MTELLSNYRHNADTGEIIFYCGTQKHVMVVEDFQQAQSVIRAMEWMRRTQKTNTTLETLTSVEYHLEQMKRSTY
ncbi:hypothetical protein [Vibrio phage RYC]|nr:hypothetical protein [Vibrio phage RYC]